MRRGPRVGVSNAPNYTAEPATLSRSGHISMKTSPATPALSGRTPDFVQVMDFIPDLRRHSDRIARYRVVVHFASGTRLLCDGALVLRDGVAEVEHRFTGRLSRDPHVCALIEQTLRERFGRGVRA